jgi:hypothetical protein
MVGVDKKTYKKETMVGVDKKTYKKNKGRRSDFVIYSSKGKKTKARSRF